MKQAWLEKAYEDFAIYGPEKLSINRIAKKINASRSSFYHHFGDIDSLIEELLAIHWGICLEFDQKGKEQCEYLIPDLYKLLAEYPIPLQFSWQLFHNRHIPRYNYLFVKTFETNSKSFILDLFARHMNIDVPKSDLLNLYLSLGEAWYSRINPNDFSAENLQYHGESIMQDLSKLLESNLYSTIK